MSDSVTPKSQHALVVEGGAMRGIFAAGVLDAFLKHDHEPFDFAIGVSAGSTTAIGYLAGDYGRSREILLNHARQPDFLNWRRYLKGGHFCDVSWLWHQSFEDVPLNTKRYFERGVPLYAVTTNIRTGKAVYNRVTEANMGDVFPASCAIPLMYREFPMLDDEAMTDGGLADAIPVIKAYKMGARKITVILSKPLGYRKVERKMPRFMASLFAEHPALFAAVGRRARMYNRALDFIANPPEDCEVTVLAPPENFPVGRFTLDKAKLDKGYLLGVYAGEQVLDGSAVGQQPLNERVAAAG